MITLWRMFFYKPLYNALVFLVDVLPNNSLFFAVIILTIIVRLILYPLAKKAIRTQVNTKKLQPLLKDLKKQYPDKQEQAKATMALYKEHKVNPFSSFLLLLLQFPVIIALYWVFRDGGIEFDPELLYSFINLPEQMNLTSFGINLGDKNIILAILTGLAQFIYLKKAQGMKTEKDPNATDQENMMMMVQKSMKFSMPIMIGIFAYMLGGAVALYWVTSNIFMIVQEHFVQKSLKKEEELKGVTT